MVQYYLNSRVKSKNIILIFKFLCLYHDGTSINVRGDFNVRISCNCTVIEPQDSEQATCCMHCVTKVEGRTGMKIMWETWKDADHIWMGRHIAERERERDVNFPTAWFYMWRWCPLSNCCYFLENMKKVNLKLYCSSNTPLFFYFVYIYFW